MPCVMSMLVLQPSTSTMIFGETGGRVAVAVREGASVKAVAVSVGVCAKVYVSVATGLTVATPRVLVTVTNTGVGV